MAFVGRANVCHCDSSDLFCFMKIIEKTHHQPFKAVKA